MPGNKVEIETWPLGLCIEKEDLAKLAQLQWELFGTKLDVLTDPPSNIRIDTQIESLEEISKIMRRKPRYKGKV